jgi:hypothetical protein
MLLKAYEYLFYKLYPWSRRVNGPEYSNAVTASFMLSATFFLNLITIWSIVIVWRDYFSVPEEILLNVWVWLGMSATIMICNNVYFFYKGRYLRVIEQGQKENALQAKKGNIIIVVYVIGSWLLLMAVWCGILSPH